MLTHFPGRLIVGQLHQLPWWRYALLALCDVEANYFVVKAYEYTSITSVMLIDCFTIPCVMILSCVFLKAKVCAARTVSWHGHGAARVTMR